MNDPPSDDDQRRDGVIGNAQAPLPEPWFIREARGSGLPPRRAVEPDPVRPVPVAAGPDPAPLPDETRPASGFAWRKLAIAASIVAVAIIVWLALLPKQGGAPPIADLPEDSVTAAVTVRPEAETAARAEADAAIPDDLGTSAATDSEPAEATPIVEAQPLPRVVASPPAPRDEPAEPESADSPSFDCRRVTSRVLEAVCANPRLAALDTEMSDLFYALRDGADADLRAELDAGRDDFIAGRQSCRDERCIARAYRDRIDELESYR